ncbi:alkaline phosphatase [Staphylococcus saccharolyticus]|uniref:Alkaline phosphatase n=1 Tax=Staphylococcus saccharolyticus TaxID=33028 RepID=A0A380GYG0_9STAP|nr:alkaline phosphatase [Staphylococcus saccharolyticus]QQB98947.1 alkaline phosphatase [Staphylococcus saccharolyticus]RTX98423.1 alkaline phosphatase [Staphylococcus saccharolyticus]SUM67955.1 alkaline phosphatase [Staphylococcus saccharolyticus]
MRLINKFGKTTIATSMVAATILGVANVSFASDSSASLDENAQGQQGQDRAIAFGNTKNPKNVIFMVSDGMGPSFNTAYRYYKNKSGAKTLKPTAFDKYLKGTNRTYPNDPKENVTDSAAGGTAFATGHKTYNGAISVDTNKKPVKSVLEQAKEQGKSTGLVITTELTDATPSVYAAHIDSRDKKDDIAQQFYKDRINGQHKVDVMLGGGSKYFGKNNGNLDKKFKRDGYDLVSNKSELNNSQSNKVLGTFSEKDMPLQIDAPKSNPLLVDMENSALNKLSKNNKGFFLMVEGASIDKAAHPNDITGVMSEMSGFETAFDNAINYAETHKDTLVVATADHSTGGLSIAKGKDYKWNPEAIHKMKHSGMYMTKQIVAGKDPEKVINEGYGINFPSQQLDKVKEAAKELHKLPKEGKGEKDEKVVAQTTKLQNAIQKPINDESHTGWTTNGHTGVDVNTYAYGPGSSKFKGNMENTQSAKNIFDFFKKDITSNQNQQ